MYIENKNIEQATNKESRGFAIEIGVKQALILSPLLLSVVLDEAIKETKKKMKH